jgi:hypothetical protein
MIVARVPEGIRVVMQTDHQAQCGLIAARWGNAHIARPEPWEPVQLAADWHDEGWRHWERTPDVQPDGRPRGFIAMDPATHMAIHRRSIAAATERDVVAGMLVGMHCSGLVQHRMGLDGAMPDVASLPDPVRHLVRDELAVRARVTDEMGDPPEVESWTWAAYRVLQALDRLSLYLTWNALADGDQWTLHRIPRHPGDDHGVAIAVTPVDAVTCALDPWPFADDSVEAPVLTRVIPHHRYDDAAHLHAAILAADPEPVAFRLVPAVRG